MKTSYSTFDFENGKLYAINFSLICRNCLVVKINSREIRKNKIILTISILSLLVSEH